ncbi:MAG: tRNA (adenosine(37)-N6)-threonylcarbamoyltransferase complex dimerization subunit type 1 TsaB [Gemmatimonadetes bacterium]|nr:tRNA (adenosine(37)-N6)-threonylcarbamoyltransferase complex dimerization subunit type 1 TsaB [Gemmatimonadota bacterium]NNM06910.1 tRNA (adenosine(37)-N6)-threonylcarbamoyltransferase complex dimerization subunit type 1 TsaB [Gemmatimonadota bacterium]
MTAGAPPEVLQPGGWFLSMDTSGKEGSVALARGEPGERMEILAKTDLAEELEHASLLVPTISDLLSEVGADPGDLNGIVVGSGPGSFTGVRVGAATAKGMAWALGVPLWGFSSLAGAAAGTEEEPLRPRLILFDARGDRVYAAAYRVARGSLETLMPPRATTVGDVLDGLIPPGAVLMGDGTVRHRDLLEGAGNPILSPPAGRPSGTGLLRLLSFHPPAEPIEDLSRWEPDYLRESGAERMWKTTEGWKGR